MDEELRAAQRRAEESPHGSRERSAYAERLLRAGLRSEAARVAGVFVSSSPLVLTLGEPCQHCDENGLVCEKCYGTGRCPDSLDNYEYDPWGMATCPCDEGVTNCRECWGTKFVVKEKRDACGHDRDLPEWNGRRVRLSRCAECGLVSLTREVEYDWMTATTFACATCGLLDCRCGTRSLAR